MAHSDTVKQVHERFHKSISKSPPQKRVFCTKIGQKLSEHYIYQDISSSRDMIQSRPNTKPLSMEVLIVFHK